VEPDLSGLPPLAAEQVAIIEVRIDATGRVTESCMLRGVRADVDRKALEAVHSWLFDPPRLLSGTEVGGNRLEAGTAVPIFMTVTVRVGHAS
jgi:TonB family protein